MSEIKMIYQQIKDNIDMDIQQKKSGEHLPSEVQYAAMFKVSRPTVRKAVEELIQEGKVRRIPGKGLCVADTGDRPLEKPLLLSVSFNPDDGFFYNLITGCIDAANSHRINYKIQNCSTSSKRLELMKEDDLSGYSAAVLSTYENKYDYEMLKLLESKKLPFILVDNPIENTSYPAVFSDDYKGGYMSGKYLIEKGHTKVLYLTQKTKHHTVKERESGFCKAFADNALKIPEGYIIELENDDDIIWLLSDIKLEYTAIMGYSSLPVIKAYDYLRSVGTQIPEQVSLMGYGDFNYCRLLNVPLTVISMPVYDMGYRATTKIIDFLRGKGLPQNEILDVELIERSSVADIGSR